MDIIIAAIDTDLGQATLAFTAGENTLQYTFPVDLAGDVAAQIQAVAVVEAPVYEKQLATIPAVPDVDGLVGETIKV